MSTLSTTRADSLPARMLVVEDDPRSRKLLEGYLSVEGYHVRSAADGQAALDRVAEQVPDVVLLDVMMPGITGHEVCTILKADPRTRLCQVMLVTALAGTPDKVHGLDCGADDYVTKPVRREEFLAKVRALLRVRRLLVELETARTELTARNEELQLKKTLAQSLVHDLKGPLSGMLGNLELLEMQCDPRLRYLIDRSRRGMGTMQGMIMDLLDVEKLEEGRLAPQLSTVNVALIARACVDDVQASATLAEVKLKLELPQAGAQAWAEADGALLRRVICNLLSNAITHTPSGREVTLAVGVRPEGVEVAVTDCGPGVPVEHREAVFEKYAQLDSRAAGVTSNRGLGLTFCRLAVEAQGGTIWIDDAPGGGAAFRVVLCDALPVAAEAEPLLGARAR